MPRERYLTKFSDITLSIGKEPEEFIRECLEKEWPFGRIFKELDMIAHKNHKPMVSRPTVTNWINKVRDDIAA